MGASVGRVDLLVARELGGSFAALLPWLDSEEPVWGARPGPQAWSVAEICEHVALTQHYLLLLIDKLAERSRRRHQAGQVAAESPALEPLDALATRGFAWKHPEHMTPTGHVPREQLRARLAAQHERCMQHLALLPAPSGSLARIRMSVVGRKLDLYEFLHVLHLHRVRHIAQMERNRAALGRR